VTIGAIRKEVEADELTACLDAGIGRTVSSYREAQRRQEVVINTLTEQRDAAAATGGHEVDVRLRMLATRRWSGLRRQLRRRANEEDAGGDDDGRGDVAAADGVAKRVDERMTAELQANVAACRANGEGGAADREALRMAAGTEAAALERMITTRQADWGEGTSADVCGQAEWLVDRVLSDDAERRAEAEAGGPNGRPHRHRGGDWTTEQQLRLMRLMQLMCARVSRAGRAGELDGDHDGRRTLLTAQWERLVAAVHAEGMSPAECEAEMVAAARDNSATQMQALLDRGIGDCGAAGVGGRGEMAGAMEVAAERGHEAVMRVMLDAGVAVDGVVRQDGRRTAIHVASRAGKEQVVGMLIRAGADVDVRTDRGSTALMLACYGGHREVVVLLVAAGAPVTARDANGTTALYMGCQEGHVGAVRVLLDAGAAVGGVQGPNGCAAMHIAALNGHDGVLAMLVAAGADVAARDADGWTALYFGSHKGHAGVVRVLLDAGAAVDGVQGPPGRTALDAATARGHVDVVQLLTTR